MTKHYTTEDIRRLVPEATEVDSVNGIVAFRVDGLWFSERNRTWKIIFETRAQLEVAREALEFLSESGNVDNLWRATEALAKIKEMQDE